MYNTLHIKYFIKQISYYILIVFVCISATFNICHSVLNYITTNISIRKSYLLPNEINNKGTHSGGNRYLSLNRMYKNKFIKLEYDETIQELVELKNISFLQKNYINEHKLIKLFKEINNLNYSIKKESTIYITPNVFEYWTFSCDMYMSPFIIPAIVNISMIRGLPNPTIHSCYGKKTDYDYQNYHFHNKYYNNVELNQDTLCHYSVENGFKYLIIIDKIAGDYFHRRILCN